MKMLFFRFLFYSCAIALTSCIKEPAEPEVPKPVTTDQAHGLTNDPNKLNGYLYASCKTSSFSSTPYYYFAAFATFGDPTRKLMSFYNHYNDQQSFSSSGRGNVSVGQVQFNGIFMSQQMFSNDVNYVANNSGLFGPMTSAYWTSEGNGPFLALSEQLNGGFPNIAMPATGYTIDRTKNFVVDLNGLVSNHDSAAVGIFDSNFSRTFTKSVPAGVQQITFTKEELGFLNQAWLTQTKVTFYAFNYCNRTINGKVYQFELSQKLEFNAQVIN